MKPWTPLERCEYEHRATGAAREAIQKWIEKHPVEVWGNSRYTVFVRRFRIELIGLNCIHMSIHDHERSATHDWRDLQQIKNEICGPEQEAIELYPAESRLVDTSNEYHLWCVVDSRLPVGYEERLVSETGDDFGQTQRPWEPDRKPKDLKYISIADVEKACL